MRRTLDTEACQASFDLERQILYGPYEHAFAIAFAAGGHAMEDTGHNERAPAEATGPKVVDSHVVEQDETSEDKENMDPSGGLRGDKLQEQRHSPTPVAVLQNSEYTEGNEFAVYVDENDEPEGTDENGHTALTLADDGDTESEDNDENVVPAIVKAIVEGGDTEPEENDGYVPAATAFIVEGGDTEPETDDETEEIDENVPPVGVKRALFREWSVYELQQMHPSSGKRIVLGELQTEEDRAVHDDEGYEGSDEDDEYGGYSTDGSDQDDDDDEHDFVVYRDDDTHDFVLFRDSDVVAADENKAPASDNEEYDDENKENVPYEFTVHVDTISDVGGNEGEDYDSSSDSDADYYTAEEEAGNLVVVPPGPKSSSDAASNYSSDEEYFSSDENFVVVVKNENAPHKASAERVNLADRSHDVRFLKAREDSDILSTREEATTVLSALAVSGFNAANNDTTEATAPATAQENAALADNEAATA